MAKAKVIPLYPERPFDFDEWMRSMGGVTTRTKVRDPLVRFSRREEALVPCRFCGVHFTQLGVVRHENKCPDNPEVHRLNRAKRKIRL